MILINKKLGETPLEALERVRREQSELATEKLSYAGRLDPMAEGKMIVLVGDENKPENRAKFLGLDKEYVATFLIGVKTDSGDCLGLVQKNSLAQKNAAARKGDEQKIFDEEIARQVEGLRQITTQTYPWFSGKAVDGVKLFEHFKAGNLDIERPAQTVEIKDVELLWVREKNIDEIKKYMFDAIGMVSASGNFRQEEIVQAWAEFFMALQVQQVTTLQTFQIRVLVSSGTFIRAFTEHFGFPALLLKLKRTKIAGVTE